MPKGSKLRGDGEGTVYKQTRRRADGTTFVQFRASKIVGYDGDAKPIRVYGNGQTHKAAVLQQTTPVSLHRRSGPHEGSDRLCV